MCPHCIAVFIIGVFTAILAAIPFVKLYLPKRWTQKLQKGAHDHASHEKH
jgi:hypothetical protein